MSMHDHPSTNISFAPWESFEAQRAWKELPEFRERIGRVRGYCEDFQPSTRPVLRPESGRRAAHHSTTSRAIWTSAPR